MAKKAKQADVQFSMIAAVDVGAPEDTVLAGLLEELQGDDPTIGEASDEIIEPAAIEAAADAADDLIEEISAQAADTVASLTAEAADDTDAVSAEAAAADSDPLDDLLEDVAGEAARIEAKQELYAEQDAPETVGEGDAPQTEAVASPEEGKKKRAGKKKDAAPKEPKATRPTSVTHKPGDLLLAKLGEKAKDYLIFSADPAENETKVAEFVGRMNDREAIADKVRDKIIMLMTWLASGKGADGLNEVLRRSFTVLHKEGTLTSGDKGNLQLDLLAKPYSMGTARSQANQMFMALPELGLTVKSKGAMNPNPDSIMLQAIYANLGL